MNYSNENFYSDDPVGDTSGQVKRKFSSILAFVLLLVGGTYLVQTTLAANISLNSGAPVEFGQGITQAVACDSNGITVRPESAFVNSQGGGSFKVGSIVFSDIDSGCSGKSFTIKAFGNTSSTPINLVGSLSSIIVKVSSSSPWFTNAATTGVSLTNTSSTGFTITLDPTGTPAATADVFKFTLESSGENIYVVGDRGPGGGIVYYVSANFFTSAGSACNTTCRYLEVAPATWQSAGAIVEIDTYYQWSSNDSVATGQDLQNGNNEGFSSDQKANWQIGKGFYNTSVMKVAGATSAAQAKVLAYAGGSAAGQWFIPSMNELNELCKYASGQTTGDPKVACDSSGNLKTGTANDLGGFIAWTYYSSSESGATFAWLQSFPNGGHYTGNYGKTESYYVRPVRAF